MITDQNGKGEILKMHYCHFYEACGSPTKDCRQAAEENYPIKQHIYYSKICGEVPKIQLLCSNEWIFADHVCPMKIPVSKGYHIHGRRQWSIGAGHNTTCRKCLLKLARRKLKTDFIFQQKLIECASPDPKE